MGVALSRGAGKTKHNDGIRANYEHCQAILDHINEYIYSVEYCRRRVRSIYHSPQCRKITGYEAAEFYQDNALWLRMIHPDDCEMIMEFLRDIWNDKKRLPIEHRILHKDGTERWVLNNCAAQRDKKGNVARLDGSMLDITELKTTADISALMTHYDPLTKLPNRNMLNSRLEKAIAVARRENKELALLFLDLDNFKFINDSLGHEAGDKLLVEISKKLNTLIRGADTVARLGGDEFVVVLWDCGIDGAALVAKKLLSTVVNIGNTEMLVSSSIGISVFPADGDTAQTLLRNADLAMYQAKKVKRGSYRFFTPELNEKMYERFRLSAEIQRALDQNEFVLFYQPTIQMRTGKICGAKALIRWVHPLRGILLPALFLRLPRKAV